MPEPLLASRGVPSTIDSSEDTVRLLSWHAIVKMQNDLTDILDQRDRDYCIAALRSRWVTGIDVCGAGGR
jgi:hypothetical protein